MTLKPQDMLEIQSAIDAYERKFPRRPAPSAEVALAWRSGKRGWATRQATAQVDSDRTGLRLGTWRAHEDRPARFEGLLPVLKGALVLGWWGVVAVVVASVFLLGAIVGGFK